VARAIDARDLALAVLVDHGRSGGTGRGPDRRAVLVAYDGLNG
jgi:hypothetical protein